MRHFRLDLEWFSRTCLPNSYLGYGDEVAASSFWGARMLMKGIPPCLSFVLITTMFHSLRGYLTKYDCSSGSYLLSRTLELDLH